LRRPEVGAKEGEADVSFRFGEKQRMKLIEELNRELATLISGARDGAETISGAIDSIAR
jgi:hypothetical protein